MTSRAGSDMLPDPEMETGGGFVPAEVGPNWSALPLPAIILDAQGRIAAMNDLAEAFLNISCRSSLGQALEGPEMLKRLRIVPRLGAILERMREGHEALNRAGVRFEIGDRSGGHSDRIATVHAGQAPSPEGGTVILLAPADGGGRLGQGQAARSAARSAIGMAEMLAHEIKNPLAGIRGAAQLIGMNLKAEDRDLADLIVAESRRIVELLDQVERFGDTSAPRLSAVNIHDVLERVRRSAAVGFGKGLRIVPDYDPSLPPALVDADQLVQVCLNLVKNAAEAIGRARQGGTIRLRSLYDGTLRLAPTEAEPQGRSLPLQIEIEDDGPGIPEAIMGEVFEPFVSGRENGTGLGLALVSKIVTDHGAWIALESRPGRTVFRISLPKA
ncbi:MULTISPECIES: two-component system sensor histidine kinase NtrB [Paracoccus]|jgi:two-component system nitrogen regulation sensor histidine kinase GlnL|uniref:histidine kinase n=1 Tax=Paracoccus denitrificans (strain Pd 1222) TaxID=318586 RepID=A1B9K0_PARDP|nr:MULTISPECIES: ATP-binding protein [Paracoccus]ABL72194.1 signal transduction histidine kinase, nitrogen specific, NtrB [Paracoccus denitrificans PD1222]MBB4625887.1 two-component system nitrogen regulation sensor histidine kinase GlnL [Paracoccus denitrificans]MCU7426949.1 ATP-binding protein [Paracoccus denitrificans]MDK8871844.1 ATP-binding protein [Paracoccus sp. SSJ]QAR28767.1 two-component sensor histidine kinase [Paracoccus denitrificans]